MSQKQKQINFRESFRDVSFGFSSFKFERKEVFIKHLSIFDQIDMDEIKKDFFESAKKRGLPTEKDAEKYIFENEIWSKKDESSLTQAKIYLESLEKTKKSLYRLSQIKQVSEQIKTAEKDYSKLFLKKRGLIGQTCEKYSEKRVTEHYIIKSFFKDPEFEHPYFSQEEIDELEQPQLTYLISEYNNIYSNFEDVNIQRIVLEDFFQMYLGFCEDVRNFYDKPLFKLSINQVKLIVYARMYKNIFENYSNIPKNIKKDPEKIIEYINSQENAKNVLENMDKDGASTMVGAPKEDYEHLGIKETKGRSLSDILKKKGGKMDMGDIMKELGS